MTNISADDYSFYRIPLRLYDLFGRRRDAFIRRELERRHPLFSGRSMFDSHIVFHKGKISANVTVMDIAILQKYRKRFPLRVLKTREETTVFIPSRIKLCIAGVVLFIGAVAVARMYRHPPQEEIDIGNTGHVPEISDVAENGILFEKISSCIKKSNGKVIDFSWKCDGERETLEITCAEMLPDQILAVYPDASVSSVTYEHTFPQFRFSVSRSVNGVYVLPDRFLAHKAEKVRGILLSEHAALQSESSDPYSVTYILPRNTFSNCLKKITDYCTADNVLISSFSVSTGETTMQSTLTFRLLSRGSKNISQYVRFAADLRGLAEKQQKKKAICRAAISAEYQIPQGEKIGEILRADGSKVRYFRTTEGKIIMEEVKEK